MKQFERYLAGVGIAVVLAATVALCTRWAEAQPTALAPFATNVVVGTTSVQIVGANPTRRGLTICNSASATNNVVIAPAPLTPTQPPSATSLGIGLPANTTTSCFTTPLVQSSGTSGGVGSAWNAIATAASTNVLVFEY